MAIGIYKAFQRKGEASSTKSMVFTTNIQIWLSVFAFSVFIVTSLGTIIGWLYALKGVPPMVIGFAVTVIGLVFICFIVVIVLSLIELFKMFCNKWKGIPYKFNPDTEPINVLKAIKPVDAHTNLKEYKSVVDRLIKNNNKLIKENNKLISEYSRIIQTMKHKENE